MNNFDKVWGACDARVVRQAGTPMCAWWLGCWISRFFISEAEEHVCVVCSVIQGLKLHRSKRKRHILLERIRDVAVLGK